MTEEEPEPTFEEYKRATQFARFRYKYGLYVTIAAWITLILLLIFVIRYAEELSEHPFNYVRNKFQLEECICMAKGVTYTINDTGIYEIFDRNLLP